MAELGPLVGILGGMGPLATADFMRSLIERTPARRDQDHIRTLVYSNPKVPDRSSAIVHGGPSPLLDLIAGIDMLQGCGVDMICIPCNTAHYWLPQMSVRARVPLLSIIDATVAELARRETRSRVVGLLGTRATMCCGIYQPGFANAGFETLIPADREIDDWVEPAVRAVKAGEVDRARPLIVAAVAALERRGAGAIVLACTELPLALREEESAGRSPIIRSTDALASACVAWVGQREGAPKSSAVSQQNALTSAEH